MANEPQSRTFELSMLLPKALDTKIHVRLSLKAKVVLLSLTTASPDELSAAAQMGSFVYALPDRFNDAQPLAATLYPHEPSLEFATRIAKLLARKLQMPVYVTNSISFANSGMGGTVEEEMEAFRAITQLVLKKVQEASAGGTASAMDGLKLQ